MLDGKHILIGIGGGIAVYRVAELARLLIKQGAVVRCVMTKAACEFVTPLTFEALTGEAVHTELFDLTAERTMGHIKLARWADVVLIAPATANQIAKYTHGIADDLLSTLFQVCDAPILLAPAMNVSMWEADGTRANVAALKARGHRFVGPVAGDLACGEQGLGRLAEPSDIAVAVAGMCVDQSLSGQHWVINAGPTHEAWDSVRILTNRASGRLGVCLAEAAALRGASVSLIAGPGTPSCSHAINRTDIESAADMLAACEQQAAHADVFIATAAVSDYRFTQTHSGKLKRGQAGDVSVELIENPDIVAHVAAMDARPAMVIAFAAETGQHIEHARDKLARKAVDAVIANDAGD
ncbi:MAG: bifunctional phosphopantothenoylcysteine decarboxylase/phosphopantothenate--cysteine ligase CoaBC, partial [Mariprofundaceae bacterium]